MAKRRKGVKRTMGARTVTLSIQFPVKEGSRITDAGWKKVELLLEAFVEQIDNSTVLTLPASVQMRYDREVETRDPFTYERE